MTMLGRRTAVNILVSACVVMLLAACSASSQPHGKGPRVETPATLRSATVTVLREIVSVTGMKVTKALYSPDSCNDQGDPPFQSSGSLDFKTAATFKEIQAQVSTWVSRLEAAGWSTQGAGVTHAGAALAKNGWVITLTAFDPADHTPGAPIQFYGPCTDLAGISTQNDAPLPEDLASPLG
jgi:hypothetical protein